MWFNTSVFCLLLAPFSTCWSRVCRVAERGLLFDLLARGRAKAWGQNNKTVSLSPKIIEALQLIHPILQKTRCPAEWEMLHKHLRIRLLRFRRTVLEEKKRVTTSGCLLNADLDSSWLPKWSKDSCLFIYDKIVRLCNVVFDACGNWPVLSYFCTDNWGMACSCGPSRGTLNKRLQTPCLLARMICRARCNCTFPN